jgi:hypothetical protein
VVLALQAALDLDRHQIDLAKRHIHQALEAAPGECYALVVQGEISLQSDPQEEACAAVDSAIEAIQKNPLMLLNEEVIRLRKLRDERYPASDPVDMPPSDAVTMAHSESG